MPPVGRGRRVLRMDLGCTRGAIRLRTGALGLAATGFWSGFSSGALSRAALRFLFAWATEPKSTLITKAARKKVMTKDKFKAPPFGAGCVLK